MPASPHPSALAAGRGWSSGVAAIVRFGPAALLVTAMAALFIAARFGGAVAVPAIADPGAVVRWGVPLPRLAYNLGAALTCGSLVVAAWVVSRDRRDFERAMQLASGGALVWTVSAAAAALMSYLEISVVPFSFDAEFGDGLRYFLFDIEIGQLWSLDIVMLALLTTSVFAFRAPWPTALNLLFALLCLWPVAALGHAAGAADHMTAVGSNVLHYTGAAVWLGGLGTVALLVGRAEPGDRAAMLERYSSIAAAAFVATAASGIALAWIHVGSLDALVTTPYGGIVVAKAVVLVALGGFGRWQRRLVIGRMRASGRPPLAWLIGVELAVMGLAAGAAAALGRTKNPQPAVEASQLADPTPAQLLSGDELPPEFTPMRLITEWRLDPIWTLLGALGLFFYLAGVARLRRRGDAWPWWRTASFALGVLVFLYDVNGALVVYGRFQFSFHMTEHMVLTMLVPIFLVLGAPITVLLRTVRARHDGSLGTREWMLRLAHSRWAAFFTHPIVAGVNFALALLLFYYTPLFRWATYDHVGHQWMIAHFLITGYLFVESLIGVDPTRHRAPYAMRLLSLILVMSFHAFFGLALMTGSGLLVADWYGATGRTWGLDAIGDQQLGGGIAWGTGEIPTVILALLVGIAWARADTRESRRFDRSEARDDDAELAAYNARLRALAARDTAGPSPGKEVEP